MKTFITIISLLFATSSICCAAPVQVTHTEDYTAYIDPAKIEAWSDATYHFKMKWVFTKKGKRLLSKNLRASTVLLQHDMLVKCNFGVIHKRYTEYFNAQGQRMYYEIFESKDTELDYIAGSEGDVIYQWVCDVGGYTRKTGYPVVTKKRITNVLDIGNE
jgi:hypothetical protein